MSMLHEVLLKAESSGASDVHLKSGQSPYFRINGELVDSGYQVLSDDDLRRIMDDIVPGTCA